MASELTDSPGSGTEATVDAGCLNGSPRVTPFLKVTAPEALASVATHRRGVNDEGVEHHHTHSYPAVGDVGLGEKCLG